MLFDKKTFQVQVIPTCWSGGARDQKPLHLIAEDIDAETLAIPIVNTLRGGLQVAVVKAPGFGDNRKAMMEDLAVLTGTTLFSEELGEKLQDVQITQSGARRSVNVTEDDTVLPDGAGEKASIERHW